MVSSSMDWRLQAGLFVAFAIAYLAIELPSRERAKRLRKICYRYAGYEDQRTGGGEYPSASKMHEGLGDELRRLMTEMSQISNEVGSITSSTYEFFVNASYELPGFLDASIGGSLDQEFRRRVFHTIAQAKTFFEDLGENPKVEGAFFDRAYDWLEDIEQWLRVVDGIGPEIGRNLHLQASNGRLC